MKKVITGGFLLLSGVIGIGFIFESAGSNNIGKWRFHSGDGVFVPACSWFVYSLNGIF